MRILITFRIGSKGDSDCPIKTSSSKWKEGYLLMTNIDFNSLKDPQPFETGSFEMALPLVKAWNLQPGYGALFKKNTVFEILSC
jgi:hypothetical protein